jgi:hypothetical protein
MCLMCSLDSLCMTPSYKTCSVSYLNASLTIHVLCRRTVISIPNGPSELAVTEAAWGLARYAAISQVLSHCCLVVGVAYS